MFNSVKKRCMKIQVKKYITDMEAAMEIIGIIGAMEEEIKLIKQQMSDIQVTKKAGLEFFSGKLKNSRLIVVRSGIGKVNAAMCTQLLIDLFKPEYIINTGVAGAISEELEIGDIVLSTELIEHDFDVTAFGHKKGVIPRMDNCIFKADEMLIERAEKSAAMLEGINIKKGIIVSGDIFVGSSELKESLLKDFSADCAEMEGAAIAHVCYLNNIPFLVIRAMSDKANGEANSNFDEFVIMAATNSKKLIFSMLSDQEGERG